MYLIDQVTKVLAVALLEPGRVVPVLEPVLQLRLVRNPGAAFSFATGATWVFTVIAVVVVVAVLRVARRLGSRGWAVALGLVLAGAAGNLTDRLLRAPGFARGHVVDFLELPNWPVFNVADSAICTAAVLVVVLALRGTDVDGRREARAPAQDAGGAEGAGDAARRPRA
ncbi:signal peptidase II [Quadrisphaera sp. DSM 44207]|uniref:signal peptidase II n=1 Tax=Quadrisphaera sp. DSM 44207 TaxID=1881057 RepID=UPI00089106CE|nr:signal peptidase II [Quadrisphaera sp. DSM 44207]